MSRGEFNCWCGEKFISHVAYKRHRVHENGQYGSPMVCVPISQFHERRIYATGDGRWQATAPSEPRCRDEVI